MRLGSHSMVITSYLFIYLFVYWSIDSFIFCRWETDCCSKSNSDSFLQCKHASGTNNVSRQLKKWDPYLLNYRHSVMGCKKEQPEEDKKLKKQTSFFIKRVCSLSASDVNDVVFEVRKCFCELASTVQRKLLFILFFWGRYQCHTYYYRTVSYPLVVLRLQYLALLNWFQASAKTCPCVSCASPKWMTVITWKIVVQEQGNGVIYVVFTWCHHFLKSTKVFILIGYKRRYIYICLQFFSWIGCFVWKPEHFEVQGYGGAWHKSTIDFVEKYILMSWFSTFLEVMALGKVLA